MNALTRLGSLALVLAILTPLGTLTASAAPPTAPFGSLDSAIASVGSVTVTGWAALPNSTQSIGVRVDVDGIARATGPASLARADVAAAFPAIGANHGFRISVPSIAAGRHRVCVTTVSGQGGRESTLGCATVTVPSGAPFGAFDSATAGFGATARLVGWAIDPDFAGPLSIHTFVDGKFRQSTTADTRRPDVGKAYATDGVHGFDVVITGLAIGTRKICTYAINAGAPADNTLLGCKSVTVAGGTPFGAFDSASGLPDGRIAVSGWAIDPDTTSAIAVHVYIDGRAQEIIADAPRPDVGRSFPGFGDNHGFAATFSGFAPGERSVCVYAINQGAPTSNPPIATWFGDWNADVTSAVRDRVTAADSRGAVATLVMYNIPNRDCGDYSANFGVSADKYRAWTRAFVAGLGTSRHIVVIEPDAVPLTYCLTAAQEQERYDLIRYAVDLLADQGSWSYIDAGHTEWVTAEDMAGRLRASGVDRATGFSLNVSNFKPTDRTVAYGTALSKLVGGKHFVVDTSRNGQGEDGNEWCNPMGMGLGSAPTTATGSPLVDAHLWIKPPGESDGGCNGGPGPGDWWREYALMLIRNAVR